MSNLADKQCVPCQGGIPPMKEEEISKYLKKVKNWEVIENHQIKKKFKFKDFKSALKFVNEVGEIAEEEDHHPNICFTWGEVIIEIYTHKIDGLHENDFILASKIDGIKNG